MQKSWEKSLRRQKSFLWKFANIVGETAKVILGFLLILSQNLSIIPNFFLVII